MAAPRAFSTATLGLLSRQKALPMARSMIQRRTVQTQQFPSRTSEILVKQRLQRPVAPHLSIYKAQITWYASGLNRITGVIISGVLYVYMMGYVVAPYAGWHLESTPMAASFAALPIVAKLGAKLSLAAPFFFHCLNGLRHLSWDVGVGMGKLQVIRSGWFVVGLSALTTAYYTFF